MSAVKLAAPCVAAHLLAAGVLRFLPTDATAECETCEGKGRIERPWGDVYPCPDCIRTGTERTGRRSLRAGDRIAIRAGRFTGYRGRLHFRDWMMVEWPSGDWTLEHYASGQPGAPADIPLRPGDIVGYATVTNVLPIKDGHPYSASITDYIYAPGDPVMFVQAWVDGECFDLSDHVDAGLAFTPGQIALELAAGDDQ